MGLVIALLVGGAILVGAFAYGLSKHKKLVGEGQIVSRNTDFAEYVYEFTSKIGSVRTLTEAINSLDYNMIGADMEGDIYKQRFQFGNSKFKATLICTDFDEPSGIAIYRFQFTHFTTNGSIPTDSLSMNKLLTQIEKVFLSLDPNTGVKHYKADLKSKHSIL